MTRPLTVKKAEVKQAAIKWNFKRLQLSSIETQISNFPISNHLKNKAELLFEEIREYLTQSYVEKKAEILNISKEDVTINYRYNRKNAKPFVFRGSSK